MLLRLVWKLKHTLIHIKFMRLTAPFRVGIYHDHCKSPSKPIWIDLQKHCEEYAALYARRLIVGRPLLVNVDPYNISDDVPDEEEIREALHRLRLRRAAGPSGMTVESI